MKEERFLEIDFARGIAVLMMIIFHIIFDLYYFLNIKLIKSYFFWFFFPRLVASIFILISGICIYISYKRSIKDMNRNKIFFKFLKRGIKIFSLGVLITIITFIFLKNDLIIFGILHFLGVSSIIAYPFLRFNKLNFIFGFFFILVGMFLSQFSFNFSYLLFLGLAPRNFSTLDYFPIFPWFGLILIGIYLGNVLYHNGRRSFKIRKISSFKFVKLFTFLGRNSLKIYFLHQPIIVLIIFLFYKFIS
ncbi:MAG: heparan-alpha-glucosaminide N-acetyltransferase [Candidatus Aenigmatarchaeota archaeon]